MLKNNRTWLQNDFKLLKIKTTIEKAEHRLRIRKLSHTIRRMTYTSCCSSDWTDIQCFGMLLVDGMGWIPVGMSVYNVIVLNEAMRCDATTYPVSFLSFLSATSENKQYNMPVDSRTIHVFDSDSFDGLLTDSTNRNISTLEI